MRDPGQKAYENWSRQYAAARALYDRESVQICRMNSPFFPAYIIVWHQLAQKWFIKRDRCCIAAWQLKSRSPWAIAAAAD